MEPLHHIALASDWAEARRTGAYTTSTLGLTIEQVGYMHASSRTQVQATLERFYSQVETPLVLLSFDEKTLAGAGLEVRVEPTNPDDPHGEKFPHVYGGALPVTAVTEVEPLALPR